MASLLTNRKIISKLILVRRYGSGFSNSNYREMVMLRSYEEFLTVAHVVGINSCEDFITRHQLEDEIAPDHICYRCQSSKEYIHMRAMLEKDAVSAWFYQTHLSRRLVGYLKLKTPIPFMKGSIDYVELQENKPLEQTYVAGFHHLECYPITSDCQTIANALLSEGVQILLKERPHHHTWDIQLAATYNFLLRLEDEPLIHTIINRDLRIT